MNTNRRHAVAALIAAGLLWGTTVPLSKLALEWLSPGWLTAARFGLAAAVLLAVAPRLGLRAAFTPKVLASGAFGYGGSVLVQNAGITRTSVTHAALLIGAVPVLVAVIAAVWHRTVARPVAWIGFVVSLGGVGLVTAGGGGGGATPAGDGLVLASLFLSATVTVAQGRLLNGRDPVAVTAVQFLAAALGALLFAVFTESAPAVPGGPGPVLTVVALAAFGTLLPFTLFAFGQSRVSAEVAGAFLNLEPLVGTIAGAVAFGDPVGLVQIAGGAAIAAGIALSSLPLLAGSGWRRAAPRRQAVRGEPLLAGSVRDAGAGRGVGAASGCGTGRGRQDHGQGPYGLCLDQDPLGQAGLAEPDDHLGAEPCQQAEHDPGSASGNGWPQSVRHRGTPPGASHRPGRQGDEAGRRPEPVGERAAAGGLRVRRDQHAGDSAGHQDEPAGGGRRPQRQPGQHVPGPHPQQDKRHHPAVGRALRRQGADGPGHRVERARLEPGRHRPPAGQQHRGHRGRDHPPPRHTAHDTSPRHPPAGVYCRYGARSVRSAGERRSRAVLA